MVAVFDIVSRHGQSIDTRRTNQPNKSYLVLCKLLIHIDSGLKQTLYILHITRQYTSVIKVDVVCMSVKHISMCLKEELIWATNKWPWVISNLKLLYH